MFLKGLGDFVTSSKGWGLTDKLGLSVNDSVIGICGLVSSTLASYEAYLKCWFLVICY